MCSDHTAYANINNYNVHTCSTQYMYMSHNSVYKLGVFYTFNFWGNRFILHNDLSLHITWIKKTSIVMIILQCLYSVQFL